MKGGEEKESAAGAVTVLGKLEKETEKVRRKVILIIKEEEPPQRSVQVIEGILSSFMGCE